jgi:L-amino acid N-acyltransferase YncA
MKDRSGSASKSPGRSDVLIRRAGIEDEPHIRAFTEKTFDWGDYVADAFSEWLESGHDVYVAEVNGIPVGVTCVAYPAEGEAWFQGIRVKAELRRMGIASMLTEASIAGARLRGARVCRANIDYDNLSSQGLAKGMGFRQAARIAEFTVPLAGYTPLSGDAPLPEDTSVPRKALVSRSALVSRNALVPRNANAYSTIRVTRVTPEEAGSLFEAASREIRYLGCEYVWVSLTRRNLVRAAMEEWLLAAKDENGRTLAGALMSNPYVEDHVHMGSDGGDSGKSQQAAEEEEVKERAEDRGLPGSENAVDEGEPKEKCEPKYLCAGLGSIFGTPEGVSAIIRHALKLLRAEATKKNITPGELFVSVEAGSPAAGGIPSYLRESGLDFQVHGETGLWELSLSV